MAQPLLQGQGPEGDGSYYLSQDHAGSDSAGAEAGAPSVGLGSAGREPVLHCHVPLVLLPVSMTPAVALHPEVQSVDLYGNAKAMDSGQGCCAYLCVRSPAPFDWVPFLHAAAHRNAASFVQSASEAGRRLSASTAASPGRAASAVPPSAVANLHLVAGAGPPVGTPASLLTMFGNSQLIFRAVREINRAHSGFWQIVTVLLVLLVLFVPGIGLVVVFAIGCSSALRKLLDDAALQRMRNACETVNQRMAAFGLGFLLMEGFGPHDPVDLEHGALGAGAALPEKRIWVLRVYMLPRTEDYTPAAAAAAAASASPRSGSGAARGEEGARPARQAEAAPRPDSGGGAAANDAREPRAAAAAGEDETSRMENGSDAGGGAGQSPSASALKQPLLSEHSKGEQRKGGSREL
ncbi:hypothetical protein BESB_017900 [Besnoitia besnoiti]|uniref:Transmembrane protein n=1 Tax=Besnoitia besnoiti TaxID=94643 RepID=A0A2A9MAQ8_BESBE|nr:hypothetical protein BESB_017900 [Besnoitia besnoiti]PFH32472.1 hypothetical protein BESB_017900 [Besnoitia besnoiti]